MPITTRWYDDSHKVILHTYEGEWTWDDLNKGLNDLEFLTDSVSYKVVVLTDMRGTNILPKGNLLAQGKTAIKRAPENISQVIIVIQSRLIEVFAGLMFEMIPTWRSRVRFVKTYEEAQKLVEAALLVKND